MTLRDHTFGKRAKEARESSGMSQEEVVEAAAKLAEVKHALSLRTLQRVEAGQSHTRKWIIQLKRIFVSLR